MSTCATASRDLFEPLAGTAATARTWLLLEQPGPWGAKALTSSHLDPALGRALEDAAEGTGVRVALIRRPGRHADCHTATRRRVFAAHVAPGAWAPGGAQAPQALAPDAQAPDAQAPDVAMWLRTAVIEDPAQLLRLDFAALGDGDHTSFDDALGGAPHTGAPLALVCTNGKRDRCCALLGRPLAAELAASGTPGAWEVTHLGGHRFSPTLLVLPYGYAYGRIGAHAVKDVLAAVAEGRIVTGQCRGSSAWERPGQAAELAVRTSTGEDRAGVLTVAAVDGVAPRWEVTVTHADGRHWRVTVAQGASLPPRPESCGSALASPARMDVVAVRADEARTGSQR